MLTLVEESRVSLNECQSRLDTLWRASECDESLLVQMSLVKVAHQDLMQFYLKEQEEMELLVEKCIHGWAHCLTVYQKIYSIAARLSSAKTLPEDFTGVIPIDPASALNIVDLVPKILLYNDNETLLKYNASELVGRDEEIKIVDTYYEKECSAMATLLAELSFVQEPSKMSPLQNKMREVFLGRVRSIGEVGVEKLLSSVVTIEKEWTQQRHNMKPYVDNLLAKFTESSRLIDNLFRAYHLTHTRRRNPRIKSIF